MEETSWWGLVEINHLNVMFMMDYVDTNDLNCYHLMMHIYVQLGSIMI